MMWDWIKDKWELVASALVVLFVFVLGRKSKESKVEVAEKTVELKDMELEVFKKTNEELRRDKALARKKFSESRLELMKQRQTAVSDLEKQTIERKLELIEMAKDDPEKIDRILLKEFNIQINEDNT